MEVEKLTNHVKFWTIIGPLTISVILFIMIAKTPVSLTFPLIGLAGIPLCCKWKRWGFALSIACLSFFLFHFYSDFPLHDRFWYLGMSVSICLALLTLSLAIEEVETMIQSLRVESKSQVETLWKLDEKLKISERTVQEKINQIQELELKIRSYKKIIDTGAVHGD